jgi:anti-sigma factor RsiW
MRMNQFDRLLDIHGPVLTRWPAGRQDAARRLLAADPAARAAFEAARRLGSLLDRVTPPPAGEARLRVAAALVYLPAQQKPLRWPTPVLLWELLPRWPRGTALAAMTALGILVGLTDLGAPLSGLAAPTGGAVAGADLSGLIFDPNPAIGLGQ